MFHTLEVYNNFVFQEGAEKQVKELQHQMSLLKSQLSHSEETQKDFVELSQSLQVSWVML